MYLILVVVLMLFVFYSATEDTNMSAKNLSLFDVMEKIEDKEITSIVQIVSDTEQGEFIVKDKDGNETHIYAAQEAFSQYLYNLPSELRTSFTFSTREPQSNWLLPILQVILIVGVFAIVMRVLLLIANLFRSFIFKQ